MSRQPASDESDHPAAASGIGASIAVSVVLHLALLGTFAAVGGFDSGPVAEAPPEVAWQETGSSIEPVTVLARPVLASEPSPIIGPGDMLSPLVDDQPPALSIAPGGGHGMGLPGRAIAASDLTKSAGGLGRGINGNGAGEGEGVGDGKGSGFFGRRATGERVVYVVDSSRSMNQPHPGPGKTRLGRVKLELINSVKALGANQKFFIVFFNDRPIPMPTDRLMEANEATKLQYLRWMIDVPSEGNTEPALALLLALKLNPDVIYFLTDGDFRPAIVKEVAVSNRRRVTIHTIGFTEDRGEKLLKAIAEQSGGSYTYVPPDEAPAEVAETTAAARP